MIAHPSSKLFWKLPYAWRQKQFKKFYPKRYAQLRAWRSASPEEIYKPTFQPFLQTKTIFIHVPKAAGIAVGHALYGRNTGNHTTWAEYQIAFTKHEFESAFVFAFVRNPFTRLLSAYYFLKSGGRNAADAEWSKMHLAEYSTFHDFVTRWLTPENAAASTHFKPQHHFLKAPTSHKINLNFLGKFENLEVDYDTLCKNIGFGSALKIKNKTSLIQYEKPCFTPAVVAKILDVYALDFTLLNYPITPPKIH